jgi:hypothetical protein
VIELLCENDDFSKIILASSMWDLAKLSRPTRLSAMTSHTSVLNTRGNVIVVILLIQARVLLNSQIEAFVHGQQGGALWSWVATFGAYEEYWATTVFLIIDYINNHLPFCFALIFFRQFTA